MLRSARVLGGRIFKPTRKAHSLRVLCTAMDSPQTSTERQKVFVRCHSDENNLIISMTLAGKQKKLNRPKLEPLEKSLGRIKIGLLPKKDKKSKKRDQGSLLANGATQASVDEMEIALFDSPSMDGPALDEAMTNEDAWCSAHVLRCGRDTYDVVLNPPSMERIIMSGCPMVAFPVVAKALIASFVDEEACLWQWFRRRKGEEWECLDASSPIYVPHKDDEGYQLRVECSPGAFLPNEIPGYGTNRSKKRRIGESVYCDSTTVMQNPDNSSGAGRHELTRTPAPDGVIRVVTYNILADQYATTEKSLTELYPYLNQRFLDVAYRMQLVLAELVGFNADIICCQEVDAKVYNDYMQPLLSQKGFEGVFLNKASNVSEGCATFVRKSRYSIVQSFNVAMKQLLSLPLPDSLKMFSPMLENSPDLIEALDSIGTVAQISALLPVDESQADHIRNMQTYAIINELDSVAKSDACQGALRTSKPATLLCGDLNCSRGGVIDLLTTGRLASDFAGWGHYTTFRWGKEPETGASSTQITGKSSVATSSGPSTAYGVDLQLPFKMNSAMSLDTPYTNYTILYKGQLDYVFYREEEFCVESIVPLPTEDQLGEAIPSEIFPSDHLSVVVDLAHKKNKHVTPVQAEEKQVPAAVAHLQDSNVIAIPTDTLYGFAVAANDSEAINKVYTMKGRASDIPLAICVNGPEDVESYCEVEHLPDKLLQSLLPGPVTLVMNRRKDAPLSPNLNPGLDTIGVRVPDSDFIRSVCKFGALALTSANHSGQSSSTRVTDFQDLWSKCAAVYDGGDLGDDTAGSTVVDLTQEGRVRVFREGSALDATMRILNSFGWSLV